MRILVPILLMLVMNPNVVVAQRDSPVWNSYLPRIVLFDQRTTLDFELTFKKAGGPIRQMHTQIYILGYLEKDEAKILELAVDKQLTSKSSEDKKLLLEVLAEKKLVVVLGEKVAARADKAPVISRISGRSTRFGNCTDFAFSFDNSSLFKSIGKLKNFDHDSFVVSDHRYYDDKFKLMVFVPVNDCKYATRIPKEQRESYDFAHFGDRRTIIQYFKALPYRFQFKPLEDEGVVLLYID